MNKAQEFLSLLEDEPAPASAPAAGAPPADGENPNMDGAPADGAPPAGEPAMDGGSARYADFANDINAFKDEANMMVDKYQAGDDKFLSAMQALQKRIQLMMSKVEAHAEQDPNVS